MTYPQQQPPVMHGYPAQPPNNDWGQPAMPTPPSGGWTPQPPKSKATPWLVGVIAVLVVAAAGIGLLLINDAGKEPTAPASPPPPALTQAGAERACRTAFGTDWKERQAGVTKKETEILVSTQEIELLETTPTSSGFVVNGTIHYTMTTGILDPIQNTLDLRCTVGGTDAAPLTVVTNRS